MSLHLRDIDSPKESHPFISTRHSHNDYDIKTSNMDSSDITDPNMDDSDNDISDTETSDVDSPDNQSPNYDSPNTDDDDSDFDDSDFYLSSDDSDDDDFDPSNYESATHYARIYEFCEAEGVDIEDLDGRYYIVDHESNGLESDGAEPDHSTTETFSTLAEWAAAEKLAVLYSYSLIPGEKPIVKWIFPVEYRKTPPPPTAIALFLTDLKYLLSWK
ncbi:hypothetical protein M7I_1522 [Glarea lozoyensis 74030]|uniref:Uncharacterized protein n=1 Tax=Glarea lozoyensis (strain ATCC 74030 / MF5533) TaxID=1104152 RepID=H0EGB0_GLAL7|nr:hypothetical protein M7I_1522 [Glarea lozoyensis 74030]